VARGIPFADSLVMIIVGSERPWIRWVATVLHRDP
jgi:hypothetical protein